jgi:antitoxin component YwqK of YwqJK toxin-antitoxin module
MEGMGTYYYYDCYLDDMDNKIIYKGEWKDNRKYGIGKMYNGDGSLIYEGEWKDDKRNGLGTSYKTDGSIEYKGEWKDGYKDI